MNQPKAKFGIADPDESVGLVWVSFLDARYQLEVWRTGSHIGNLFIWDHNADDKEIHSEPVSLSYGAQFGPDVSDVNEWCAKGITIVDGLNGNPGNS
jgi:hypothetical protein